MRFKKQDLDLILVPSGLLIMFTYHLLLLYKYIKRPHTTAIGYQNNDKSFWVEKMITTAAAGDKSAVTLAVTVISSNQQAAIYLSTISLTLTALIGAWLGGGSYNTVFRGHLVYGDTTAATISVKYICLLTCFLLAFAAFVQSVSHFVHAGYVITMPPPSAVPVEDVKLAVIRGSEFWSLGLRAIFFALNLLLWFFGPIPMFVSSLSLVFLLHFLDTNTKKLHHHHSPHVIKCPYTGSMV